MKAQFIVTIEGNWLVGGKPLTVDKIKRQLIGALQDEFDYLADRVTIKRCAEEKSLAQTDAA